MADQQDSTPFGTIPPIPQHGVPELWNRAPMPYDGRTPEAPALQSCFQKVPMSNRQVSEWNKNPKEDDRPRENVFWIYNRNDPNRPSWTKKPEEFKKEQEESKEEKEEEHEESEESEESEKDLFFKIELAMKHIKTDLDQVSSRLNLRNIHSPDYVDFNQEASTQQRIEHIYKELDHMRDLSGQIHEKICVDTPKQEEH